MQPRNYSLHHEDYSIKNCLLWGVSKAHFQQTKAAFEGKAYGRAFQHLVAGLFEAIPFLGQILSLAERRFATAPTNTLRNSVLGRDNLQNLNREPVQDLIPPPWIWPISPSSIIPIGDPNDILKPVFEQLKAVINGVNPTDKQRGMFEFKNYMKTLPEQLQGVVQDNSPLSLILLSFLWIQWALSVYNARGNWEHVPLIDQETTSPVQFLSALTRILSNYKLDIKRLKQINFTPFIPTTDEIASLTSRTSTLEQIIMARIHSAQIDSRVQNFWVGIAQLCSALPSQQPKDG